MQDWHETGPFGQVALFVEETCRLFNNGMEWEDCLQTGWVALEEAKKTYPQVSGRYPFWDYVFLKIRDGICLAQKEWYHGRPYKTRSLDQTLPGCRANGYTFLKDGCAFEQDVDLSVYIQSFDKESRSAARLYLQGYDRMNIRDRLRLSPARMQQVDARLRRYMQLYMAV